MKVLVCGGRNFSDAAFIHAELDRLNGIHGFTVVIEGDARGVDRIAGEWARSHNIELIEYPANWERDGRHAALIRNEHMLTDGKPDLVVAFPGGSGTSHTCWKAEQASIPVIKVTTPAGQEVA
jgi:YspA, cpYpsA-related SLOG family